MTAKEQVIQAAICSNFYHSEYAESWAASERELEAFYNLAYKAGEKAMQERAAKVADEAAQQVLEHNFSALIAYTIRALKTGDTNE